MWHNLKKKNEMDTMVVRDTALRRRCVCTVCRVHTQGHLYFAVLCVRSTWTASLCFGMASSRIKRTSMGIRTQNRWKIECAFCINVGLIYGGCTICMDGRVVINIYCVCLCFFNVQNTKRHCHSIRLWNYATDAFVRSSWDGSVCVPVQCLFSVNYFLL